MKKFFRVLFSILLVLSFCLTFAACGNEAVNEKLPDNQLNDDNYFLTVSGISADDIIINKSQIKELFKTKPVVYTSESPVYASDKTDDDGNLIPHTLQGVYLDDLLNIFAEGAVSGTYSSMTLNASDGYETVLTSDIYNTEHGGSKMIIAINYDGNDLNENAKSGALRAVFPDQIANSWAKKLTKITFGNATLLPPEPAVLNFAEFIDGTYFGQFTKTVISGVNEENITYFGISLKKLFDSEILKGGENEKMFLTAWDFISNGTDSFYREYVNWKSFDYYSDAYLVYETKTGVEEKTDYGFSPAFNGANIQSGMSVKNVLSLSVKDTALVSLKIAFERFDSEKSGSFAIKELLSIINMFDNNASYRVTLQNGSEINLSGTNMETATISKNGEEYSLVYGENTALLKSIEIIK